tara:strand:+ start:247 stop:384 length:138 start_codon:yes stop_codon:yes gene_type:complete
LKIAILLIKRKFAIQLATHHPVLRKNEMTSREEKHREEKHKPYFG